MILCCYSLCTISITPYLYEMTSLRLFNLTSFASCFIDCYGDHRDLLVLTHSFPTRRSSYLPSVGGLVDDLGLLRLFLAGHLRCPAKVLVVELDDRSEEHTSELQSLMRISYADFCLKIKTKQQNCRPVNHTYTNSVSI